MNSLDPTPRTITERVEIYTIGTGGVDGVGGHVVGRSRRGGLGLTQGRVRFGKGDGAWSSELRVMIARTGDEGRRRWNFPSLQCSLGSVGFVGGVVAAQANLVFRDVAPTLSL